MESSKQSDKIRDIVKLKQMLKKWRIQATSSNTTTAPTAPPKKGPIRRINSENNNKDVKKKGISFLKRTLSFTDLSTNGSSVSSPKGFLAVDVGEEMKRFVIPTNYLRHEAFCSLLKDAEDEFGFQQEGVLRIPCEIEAFERLLVKVEGNNSPKDKHVVKFSRNDGVVCSSGQSQSISASHRPPSPMCR